jgi:hypothetical protein
MEGLMSFVAERITRTKTISLQGPLGQVFPLFGALEEAKWAPGWAPKVIYPENALLEEHMVFKTPAHDEGENHYTWTVSRYDPDLGSVEYTVFAAERLWWITINCRSIEHDKKTEAEVCYTYTGLTEKGNLLNKRALAAMFEHDL